MFKRGDVVRVDQEVVTGLHCELENGRLVVLDELDGMTDREAGQLWWVRAFDGERWLLWEVEMEHVDV